MPPWMNSIFLVGPVPASFKMGTAFLFSVL